MNNTPWDLDQHALNYLSHKAEADRQKAFTSLSLLLDHSAGIGDHSTNDYYQNLDVALDTLVDAEDRIEILHKYFLTQEWEDDKSIHGT